MKKLYYTIELRISADYKNRKEDDWIQYYNHGYIIINNGNIEGYLTNDLLSGIISNSGKIHVQLVENKEKMKDVYYSFSSICEDLKLPGEYELEENRNPNIFAKIFFIKSEKEVTIQKLIEEKLKQVKILHQIIP